ncbi:hypothetical protein VTK73DRAFT_2611 [Phialemonium thermophilum]|uniref:Uncharacterized protein n=1 Tax=Phialemonium thermophilum TaxID=223376 RepID=A0ABR3VRC3_9PEZI
MTCSLLCLSPGQEGTKAGCWGGGEKRLPTRRRRRRRRMGTSSGPGFRPRLEAATTIAQSEELARRQRAAQSAAATLSLNPIASLHSTAGYQTLFLRCTPSALAQRGLDAGAPLTNRYLPSVDPSYALEGGPIVALLSLLLYRNSLLFCSSAWPLIGSRRVRMP